MGIPKRMNVEIRNADFMHVNQNGEVVIRLRLYYETRNRVVYLPELILNMNDFALGRLLEALQRGARNKIEQALAVIQTEKRRADAYRDEINK